MTNILEKSVKKKRKKKTFRNIKDEICIDLNWLSALGENSPTLDFRRLVAHILIGLKKSCDVVRIIDLLWPWWRQSEEEKDSNLILGHCSVKVYSFWFFYMYIVRWKQINLEWIELNWCKWPPAPERSSLSYYLTLHKRVGEIKLLEAQRWQNRLSAIWFSSTTI